MSPSYPLGVDILETNKARAFYRRHRRGLDQLLNPSEIVFIDASKKPEEAFAMIFAAKEAVFKALGASWMGFSGFRQVRISPRNNFSFSLQGALKKYSPKIALKISFQKTASHVIATCHPRFVEPCAGI